jgi:hypothetical protein
MQKLKQKLLDTEDFKDCEALDKYCELIHINRNRESFSGRTQDHHILPRAWFKLYGKQLDSSPTNMVELLISDHAKAHLFLFQAAINPEVKAQNAAAVRYMCDLFLEELIDLAAEDLNRINEEVSKAKSKALAERRAQGLNERRRAVICIETGQEFKTIKAAQEATGLFIKQHLRGLAENAGGYHFKYLDGETPQYQPKIARFTKEELDLLRQLYPKHGTKIPELLKRHSAETLRCKAWELKLQPDF